MIQDEHRSLAAVLHGMLYLVHEIRDRGAKPNFELLGAMIFYIDAFPERFHHPKEDDYLFRSCACVTPTRRRSLDRLQMDYRVGAEKIARSSRRWPVPARRCRRILQLAGGGRGLRRIPLGPYAYRGKTSPAARAEIPFR